MNIFDADANQAFLIQASKTGSADFQDQIAPDPAGVYSVAAEAVFTFSLLYYDHTQDIYSSKNPDTIKVTLTIEDDNGNTYDIEASAAFEWLRY